MMICWGFGIDSGIDSKFVSSYFLLETEIIIGFDSFTLSISFDFYSEKYLLGIKLSEDYVFLLNSYLLIA